MSFYAAFLDEMRFTTAQKHPAGNTEETSGKYCITILPYFNTFNKQLTFKTAI